MHLCRGRRGEARCGRAICPACEAKVVHSSRRGCYLKCANCGWSALWDDYRKSFAGQHLIAPGLQPFCREYLHRLPTALTPRARMYWIDWLIHRCHWDGTALPGQLGATSLIIGRMHDVSAFLSTLTAGNQNSQAIGDLSQLWDAAQLTRIKKWRNAADRRSRKRRHPDRIVLE